MASQDQSWFKHLFHLEKRGLKKIHQIKHTCCLFDRREYIEKNYTRYYTLGDLTGIHPHGGVRAQSFYI